MILVNKYMPLVVYDSAQPPICSTLILVLGAKLAPNPLMDRLAELSKRTNDRIRQSLRLDPQLWAAIDVARQKRAGSVSRNTWITEAIMEKVAREEPELSKLPMPNASGGRHA